MTGVLPWPGGCRALAVMVVSTLVARSLDAGQYGLRTIVISQRAGERRRRCASADDNSDDDFDDDADDDSDGTTTVERPYIGVPAGR